MLEIKKMNTKPDKTILIVEDEPRLIGLLAKSLTTAHFNVLQEVDGAAGLHASLEKHPDLIMLDILMPKMDGIEVLQALRKDTWGAKVPVILLTNLSADDRIMKSIVNHEPSYYVVKANMTLEGIVGKARAILKL